MNTQKQLFKILIGVAWLDGTIQPAERQYLNNMAQNTALDTDTEIQTLLSEQNPVNPEQCYNWVQNYLGPTPTPEDHNKLIESISALIYSDGDVAINEAQLLTELQNLDISKESNKTPLILKKIQQLYQRWINQQT